MEEYLEGFGMYNGKIVSSFPPLNISYPRQRGTTGYTAMYQMDGNTQEFQEASTSHNHQ